MKRPVFTLFLLICLSAANISFAARLNHIRLGYYPEKIRVVLDFDEPFTYKAEETKDKIFLRLLKVGAGPDIQNYVELSDLVVRYLEVEKEGEDINITIPLPEPIPHNIFSLSDPARLVIDFEREFTNIVSGGTITEGAELLTVSRGTSNGRVKAHVIRIDPDKTEIYPALARKKKAGMLESFFNIFNPWKEKEDDKHFYRARVSDIAAEQRGVAAVNGTFFAYTGKPLGTLLIDKELVSSPIYDRTAFFVSDDNRAYIDNIYIECYFMTPGGIRYNITGVNQGRGSNSVILYSPIWGERTETGSDGIELAVSDSIVREIKLGNASIPSNGYAISISGPAAQFVNENIKVGDRIDTHIKITPHTTSPSTILHLISGGPRLLKNGVVYVSKHEEKFKADIAKGRAARTAVGVTRDNKILLVAVDGLPRGKNPRNGKESIGMTLEELAELMRDLGAVEAMNLDGGSSTTMWANGRVINQTVSGSQQKVSNALVVRPRY